MIQEYKKLEAEFQKELAEMPSGVLMTYYMIAKHHERYRLTGWILKILTEREFTRDQINEMDDKMEKVYLDILNGDNL